MWIGIIIVIITLNAFEITNVMALMESPKENSDANELNNGYLLWEECWQLYPYTYSKCLKICSPHLDATCLDDQLCYCNNASTNNLSSVEDDRRNEVWNSTSRQQMEMVLQQSTTETKLPSINMKFGAHSLAACHFSDFCEELCQTDDKLSVLYPTEMALGALCKIPDFDDEDGRFLQETVSCICTVS